MNRIIKQIRHYADYMCGLGSVPGLIVVAIWLLAFCCLYLEHTYFLNQTVVDKLSFDTASTVLSVIAGATIGILGIVYSIVLLVFTTAAGNIGPRLLQRFTGDRVNQITAGLLGGSFLFSVTALYHTEQAYIPTLTVVLAFFISAVGVLQFIYFIRTVAKNVTVDQEIADISQGLERKLSKLVDAEQAQSNGTMPFESNANSHVSYVFEESGYITRISIDQLISMAQDNNLLITVHCRQGDFVLQGHKGLVISLPESTKFDIKRFKGNISQMITLSPYRKPEHDIEFSMKLLVEIAVRALSPGVNDTFTAIAVLDRLSSACLKPVKHGLRDSYRNDKQGIARVKLSGLTLELLLKNIVDPFRQLSIDTCNVLMIKHLIKTLNNLNELANKEASALIAHHFDSISNHLNGSNINSHDKQWLISAIKR